MLIHKHTMYTYIQLIRLLYVMSLTCHKKLSGCQQSAVYLQVSSANVMHFQSVYIHRSMQSFPQKYKGWGGKVLSDFFYVKVQDPTPSKYDTMAAAIVKRHPFLTDSLLGVQCYVSCFSILSTYIAHIIY